jgi:hypothetical protein
MTEFKNYPREYEYVFTDKDKITKKCSFDKISFLEDTPKTIEEYIKLMRWSYDKMEKEIFDSLVKIIWLEKRFCYDGRACNIYPHTQAAGNYVPYKTFILNYIGRNRYAWFHGLHGNFNRIVSYIDSFFPYFLKGNPFEGGYEYPYQYMNFECLMLVYQMPERLDLLAYADSKKMGYAEFFDYILNYINCYNDEKKEEIYNLIYFGYYLAPYVKYKYNKDKLTGRFFYIKKEKK